MSVLSLSRRVFLASVSALALTGVAFAEAPAGMAEHFPLSAVRLKPSIYLDAVNTNRTYLLSLEPDRFLHNFRKGASLAPKGEVYGGWEARGIAGHCLGHYLSALSLMHAQTGDVECLSRARYIVRELAECQRAHGDGYAGGTTVERNGKIVDGKIVYEEVKLGLLRAGPFDVNGGWVPFYTYHKVLAGALDAHLHCGDADALAVARGLADYIDGVVAGLDETQMQALLAAEHGGLNESFAELFARTNEPRYLALARRFRHRAVLDPLAAERDELAGKHANTQIPKVIGLARLYEVAGDAGEARAARFFYETVTKEHSFVIGGNSEREHFAGPGITAPLITDRTCEACNSYNMLRLTRHLWRWKQDASYFDAYERAHLNHIMAHQHPRTGMFVYFMPMLAGAKRLYSTPTDTFWCCVGSGMESHAKHGESIYAKRGDTLFVNLFIPSSLDWAERGAKIELDTAYPNEEQVALRIAQAGRVRRFSVAMRLPTWCATPSLQLNGRGVAFEGRDGYAVVTRRWRNGDELTLTLPMHVNVERVPDDQRIVALVRGPLVLAADLGPAEAEWRALPPTLAIWDMTVESDPVSGALQIVNTRPGPLALKPFYALHDRRAAPYLRYTSDAEWTAMEAAFAAAEAKRAALDARTVDWMRLGEAPSEAAHAYRHNAADHISYERVSGRQAWWGVGNWFEFDIAVERGVMKLHALYWGEEVNKDFEIKVDGAAIARERRAEAPTRAFVEREYEIPQALTRGKRSVTVRFETRGSDAPVYGVRMLRA